MNILVNLTKEFRGCGFYRLYQPHFDLAKKKLTTVTLNSGLWKADKVPMTDEEVKKFDIIIWHKGFFDINDIRRAKRLGVITIADFDDHWILDPGHTLRESYRKENTSAKLHRLLLEADYVTCTTEDLADEIYYSNKNVEVLPNAMDMSYPFTKVERQKEDKFVFGYLGGHFHLNDVRLLRGLQKELSELNGYNLRLFGYDGTFVYNEYASILSDGDPKNPNFSIYKGMDIFAYPHFYNLMDCSLVPLTDNRFNRFKSELKMIEAGFFKKAVIVSNVKPYTNVINKDNCLIVNDRKDWSKYCQTLIENPELAKELGENLFKSVQEYSIDNVNKKRFQFYSDVHKKHNINSSIGACRLEVVN